ncbi:MAG TPA: amidohydrolase family protein [Myxococcota bacterium]|nr:amidohydrolase family protein [Myxococcota bacterium]
MNGRPFTVDLHGHMLVPAVERLVAARPEKQAEPELQLRTMGRASVEHNARVMIPAIGAKLVRVETRIAELDRLGIDVQVVSPAPNQYYYWADRELASELVRVQNEAIAEACASHPTRLRGLGNVALQHGELAADQLEHALRRLGLAGVEISTQVNGLELCDEKLERFWARAESLGALVFIHPFGTSLGERAQRFYLSNLVGNPAETALALSFLIFGGTLDRHPGVKILAAHGGGYLPTYASRSDHGWNVRPEARTCREPPSHYLRRLFFDSLVYEPEALRRLIDAVGASQVVIGTDYPFDMGHYEIEALLARVPGLGDAEREAIRGGNARKLLGL